MLYQKINSGKRKINPNVQIIWTRASKDTSKVLFLKYAETNTNPTPELTWGLILGLARNFKEEIDNMFQGYWQTKIIVTGIAVLKSDALIT